MQVTLLEATKKKCVFLEEVTAALRLSNVQVVWQRAEEAGTSSKLREAGGASPFFCILTRHALYGLGSPGPPDYHHVALDDDTQSDGDLSAFWSAQPAGNAAIVQILPV